MPGDSPVTPDQLTQVITGTLRNVIELFSAEAPIVTASASTGDSAGLEWHRFTARGAAQGSISFGCSEQTMRRCLPDAAEPGQSIRDTADEVFTQVAAGLATYLTGVLGREVVMSPSDLPADHTRTPDLMLTITNQAGVAGMIGVQCDLAGQSAPVAGGSPQSAARGNPTALERMLDVEMPVSVSFGRTQLQIRDVLKLSSGSIVELNRCVSEPVDLVINGCVIARGDVVVVEGNYGIRIQQIMSAQDRLRSLG